MPEVPRSYLFNQTKPHPKSVRTYRGKKLFFTCFSILIFISFYYVSQNHRQPGKNFHIKQAHSDFIGRESYLEILRKICIKDRGHSIPVVALWGESGIGKSEIAITFANRESNYFSLSCLIDSSSEESYKRSYSSLAQLLNIPLGPKEMTLEVVRKVHHVLERQTTYQPWLLILDNQEIPVELPQKGKGAIIVTTRNLISWHSFPCFEITQFSETEASTLLKKIIREPDSPDRLLLANELGCFPLAINFAAHYIAETPGMTEKKYLQLLSQHKISLIETSRLSYQLLALWKATSEALNEKCPEALKWLHFCTFLSSEGIPASWIEAWLGRWGGDLFFIKKKSNDILSLIVNQALMRYDQNTQKLFLHRLKQELFKNGYDSCLQLQNQVVDFLCYLAEGFERIDELERNPQIFEKLAKWEPHALHVLTLFPLASSNEKLTELINAIGCWKCARGEYESAELYLTKAMQNYELLFGCENHKTIVSMNNVAWTLGKLGQLEKAQNLYEKALSICWKIHPPDHPDIHSIMNNMSLVFKDLGKYDLMRKLNEAALEIRERIYGRSHPYTADSMHNLACALWKLGVLDKAQEYYQKALEIYTSSYGNEHLYVTITMHSLARVFVSQKKYSEAEKLYLKVLALYAKIYGAKHPYIAICLNHLGEALEVRGHLDGALNRYMQAFEISCYFYHSEHPAIIDTLDKLIQCLIKMDKSYSLNEKIDEIHNMCKVLKENHPLVLSLLNLKVTNDRKKFFYPW